MAKKLYNFDTSEEVDIKDLINDSEEHHFSGTRPKKGLFVIMLLVAIALFLFLANYWYGNMQKSLGYEIPDFIQKELDANQPVEVSLEDLKNKDTDHDGLSDFTELYQSKTSIFLEDTDSDGVSDFAEINQGGDALCPQGEDCSLLALITPENKLSDILQNTAINTDLTLQLAALNEFRQFLLDNGMTKEDLSNLTDADLMEIFQAISDSEIIPAEAWTATTTPEQVRKFLLLQPGADLTQIKKMSVQELTDFRNNLLKK
jgi:hypothetical protein